MNRILNGIILGGNILITIGVITSSVLTFKAGNLWLGLALILISAILGLSLIQQWEEFCGNR